MFKPPEQMTTPMRLQKRKVTTVSGAKETTYKDAEQDPVIMCNFKSKGGTESTHNGQYIVLDTATVQTWYRPDIKKGDRLIMVQDGSAWDIKGNPENIEMRNQMLILKVQNAGGA